MKPSTLIVLTAAILLGFHGGWHFFGISGATLVLGLAIVFWLGARLLYRHQLRRLHEDTRGLSAEQRRQLYDAAQLDAEARRDLEQLVDRERKDSTNADFRLAAQNRPDSSGSKQRR